MGIEYRRPSGLGSGGRSNPVQVSRGRGYGRWAEIDTKLLDGLACCCDCIGSRLGSLEFGSIWEVSIRRLSLASYAFGWLLRFGDARLGSEALYAAGFGSTIGRWLKYCSCDVP